MKTLKKTLSLTLVFAMVFSLMSMAFAAPTATTTKTTGYTDAASITYKEAVDVNSAIGVFQGNDSNAFAPKDNLTREQAAKVICYLTLGKAAADKLTTASAPFTDVPAARWSAGSVAYCKQQGIIAGYGDGKFGPTDTVTGYQFAKMLLVALGYDATIEQFNGSDWSINVAKRAFANKLFAGNDAFVGTNPATREEAALYVLNTLQAYEVSYANKGTNITLPDGTTVNTGATPAASTGYKFMATHYSKLSVTDTADDAGRSIRVWKNGVTTIGSYASIAAVASWTADYTAATDNTVAKALAGYTYAATITEYNDGVTSTLAKAGSTYVSSDIATLTGNGVLVEVFADANNAINRVSVTTQKLATIINKDTVNKTVTVNDGAYQVTLSAKSDTSAYGSAYTALYAKNVGDKVLLTDKADATHGITAIFSYADPTVVTGQYTAKSAADGTWTIGGKAYEANKAYTPSFVLGNTVSVYLDSYGYMTGLNTSATTTTYAFALALSRDGSAMAGYTYNAKLLFGDGSVKWVKIAAYNGSTDETLLNTYVSTAANANQFVGYSAQADGSLALAAVTPTTVTSSAPAAITKDSSSLSLDGSTTKLVTNSTVFLIYNSSTKAYDAYKGIKNVPTTAVASGKAFGLLDSTSSVYGMVVVNEGATASADSVYIYDTTATGSTYVNGVQIDTYKAIVNGVIGTVNVKHLDAAGSPVTVSAGLTIGNKYSNGVIVAFSSAPTTPAPATFTKAADANKAYSNTVVANKITLIGGVLSDATSTGIVGDNFVCYVVNKDNTVTVKSLGSTANNAAGTLNYVIDSNGYVAYAILVLS